MLFSLITFGLNDNYNFFYAFNTFHCPYFRTLWSPQLRWGFKFSLFIWSIFSRWTPPLISRLTFQQRFIPNFNGKTMNMCILSLTISKYLLIFEISFSSRHVISLALETQARIYYSWWPVRLPTSALRAFVSRRSRIYRHFQRQSDQRKGLKKMETVQFQPFF